MKGVYPNKRNKGIGWALYFLAKNTVFCPTFFAIFVDNEDHSLKIKLHHPLPNPPPLRGRGGWGDSVL
jgi:hypothetical protein